MVVAHHIKISGNGISHVVEIDGHPVQNLTESLELSMSSVALPVLILRLALPRGTPEVDTRALVRFDEETTEALKAMGWTPPSEEG
jgi:hypothetical protein